MEISTYSQHKLASFKGYQLIGAQFSLNCNEVQGNGQPITNTIQLNLTSCYRYGRRARMGNLS